MGIVNSTTVNSKSPDATTLIARAIAPDLRKGDLILLSGEIGAGKSLFARGIISERLARVGRSEDIPSPTFTLVQTYDDGDVEFWHADLYRLTSDTEITELGLLDAFEDAVCIVEWPEKIPDALTHDALRIEISAGHGDDERILTFSYNSDRWKNLLSKVKAAANG